MRRLPLLAFVAIFFVVFTGCEKSDVTPDSTTEIIEESAPTTYNFRHQFTGAEMDQMIFEFTGKPTDNLTEKEKMEIMGEIRLSQLKEREGTTGEAEFRSGGNDWICYAITKLKATPSTPDNQAIFIDDADVSTTGIQRLTADAGYSEPVPVNYYQVYSFGYVKHDTQIVDYNDQNYFNFTCNGEDFTFAIRSKAVLLSNGGTYVQASYRCQD